MNDRLLSLARTRYDGGITTYLEVVVAEATALTTRRAAVDLLTRRMTASVDLVKALGGGWDASALPSAGAVLSRGSDGEKNPEPASDLDCGEVALADHDLSVLAVEAQLPAIAPPLLEVEGHAGLDGLAVDVEGDDRLPSLHDDLMDRLHLVHGVHGSVRVALLDLAAVEVELRRAGQAVHARHVLVVGGVAS